MKPSKIHSEMINRRLDELERTWKELSEHVRVGSGAHKYIYTRQHGSRAARWLPFAIASSDEAKGRQEILALSILQIARLPAAEIGVRARAAFLEINHGIDPDVPVEALKSLPKDVLKAANNVSESVRRVIKFFQALVPEEELPENNLWPPPPQINGLERGVRLYRDIRRAHLRGGILNPADHVPAITARVAGEHAERGRLAGSYGSYNMMIRNLRQMLAEGHVNGVPPNLADGLAELRLNPNVGAHRILPVADLASRWPAHFRTTSDGKVDHEYGLPAFFNRELGLNRPPSPLGASCPPENLLGSRALPSRIAHLRRFLIRVATSDDLDLAGCFMADRVWKWLTAYIGERGEVSATHLQAWWAIRYTARTYFGLDTADLDERVEKGYEFPASGSSLKGIRTVQKVRQNPVGELLAQAAALHNAAESSHKPGPDRRTGLYYARKSAEVDFWIRLLTGLRPSNVDSLEVLERPQPETLVPAIWRAGSAFVVCIPFRCMKQNKRRSKGSSLVKIAASTERPYVFEIHHPPAVAAVNEYLTEGWCHAADVHAGQSRNLLLNSKGRPFRSFEASQRKTRKRALHLHGDASSHADLDRYATRHIMAELLRQYLPGGRLATLYLTHRSETNADKHYGSDDHAFLRQCIHEILEGRPPLPEQKRLYAEQMRQEEQERSRMLKQIADDQVEMNSQIAKLAAALAAKDAEVRELRGKLAETKRGRSEGGKAA